jgi:hypothetical protein
VEQISGFAGVMARATVQQLQTKPLLRKPYVKFIPCSAYAADFMQLGAILAAKNRGRLDAFGHAFLGLCSTEPGAFERFVTEAAADVLRPVNSDTTFVDYVRDNLIGRWKYAGNTADFFLEHALMKIPASTAVIMMCNFAEQGVVLGAAQPDLARTIYEQTHALRDTGSWKRAYDAGLDIPAEQDQTSYDEVEAEQSEKFMIYCQELRPSLHQILSS